MLNFSLIFQSTTLRVFAINQDVEFVTQLSVGKTITSWLKDAQGLAIFIVMICARRHNGRKQSGFIQQFQLVSLLDLFWQLLLWHVLSPIFTGKGYYLQLISIQLLGYVPRTGKVILTSSAS